MRRLSALTVAALCLATGACAPENAGGWSRPGPQAPARAEPVRKGFVRRGPVRAIWVTRGDYRTPEDIRQIMDHCRDLGLSDVIFQVRGHGTAFWDSRIEPWADELGGRHPGYDPLAVAIREAHARDLALHGWVNVMPAWCGREAPRNPRQLYNAHPDWFWYDQKGERQPLLQMDEGRLQPWYVSVNPCLPEVRQYLVSVFEEIARNYEIDGLHLDYIRFPNDNAPKGVDYPYDARTLALYRSQVGRAPADSRELWTQWRTEQVSRIVYDTRVMMRRTRPAAKLTASVAPDPDRAKAAHYQDGGTWAAKDWVDFLCPMNYTADEALFVRRADAWRRRSHGKPVVMGLGLYMHKTTRPTIRQMELVAQWKQGFCLFSYSSLFASATNREGFAATWGAPDALRNERLNAVRPIVQRIAAAR